MTTNNNPSRGFAIPEVLKRPDIGVKEITLTQRIMSIKYFVSDDMKGDIRLVITGAWDTDVNQLKNKVTRKGFSESNTELLIKGFGLVYSGEGPTLLRQSKHGVSRTEEAQKLHRQSNRIQRKHHR